MIDKETLEKIRRGKVKKGEVVARKQMGKFTIEVIYEGRVKE